MSPQLLLLLPTLASCGMNFRMIVRDKYGEPKTQFDGQHKHIVTDKEAIAFQLNQKNLRDGAENIYGGEIRDIHLHRPILYATNPNVPWLQVSRILKPTGVYKKCILAQDIRSHKDRVFTKIEGYGNPSRLVFVNIKEVVGTNISVKWLSRQKSFDVDEDMSYSFIGPNDLSFKAPWGVDSFKYKPLTITAGADVELTLKPDQIPVLHFFAVKVLSRFLVTYKATLEGYAAGRKRPKAVVNLDYHVDYNLDVNKILKDRSLPLELEAVQIIDIEYFTDIKVVVNDKVTDVQLFEREAVPVEEA